MNFFDQVFIVIKGVYYEVDVGKDLFVEMIVNC